MVLLLGVWKLVGASEHGLILPSHVSSALAPGLPSDMPAIDRSLTGELTWQKDDAH